MTVAPLIAMKSTKCESLEAVGKELDRRAHTYANDIDGSGRHIGYRCRAEDERPVPLEKALKRDLAALEKDMSPVTLASEAREAARASNARRGNVPQRDRGQSR